MKCKLICAAALLTILSVATPAQTRVAWTMECSQAPGLGLHIQNGPVRSFVGQYSCTVTGEIAGVAGKSVTAFDYEEESSTLYKAWGGFTETFANGDQVTFTYQTTAPVKNGTMTTGQKTFQITGGTGSMKGITGSGTCSIAYNPSGGGVQACAGTYKLP